MKRMTRVGVTGAAGFIGSNLCERLLRDGYEVVGVDDLSYGSLSNIAHLSGRPGWTFAVLDCTREDALRAAFDGCEALVHLAAKKIPRFGGTLATLEVNVAGMNSVCAVALALDADLVVTSTSDVYGNATPPFAEDSELVIGPPTTKRWAYAVSKMYDEHVALALAEERGLRVTILRLFNAYGPRNHLSWWGGPVVTFFESLLDGELVEIHGDGLQTRTFTYVADIADGIVRAVERPATRGEVINLGGTETVTILELAEHCHVTLGLPTTPLRARFLPYTALPGRYQDVLRRAPDTTKARRLLGFEATIRLADGLRMTAEWHRSVRSKLQRAATNGVASAARHGRRVAKTQRR
jgi:UDP-glucose 4-epimerase